MTIVLTRSAAEQVTKQLAKRGKGVGLRVGVKKVGCSGLAYTFDSPTKFTLGDHLFEVHDAKLVVDAHALSFLDGSRLDFVKEGLKQVFKFDNPNVESTCGCGESLNVKAPTSKLRNLQ